MAYRSVNFVSNGFGASNYTPAGPFGNQFITPYGDPYRVNSVGFSLSGIWSGLTNLVGNIGKVAAPIIPGLAQVGVSKLIGPSQQPQAQQPSQSQFTQVSSQAAAQQANVETEKSNTVVYIAVGAVALVAAYYFLSKRRSR
jgi:hypothetical protein